jgi:hypothetical protein
MKSLPTSASEEIVAFAWRMLESQPETVVVLTTL